ncbi:MAG: 50S ribosomal protein L35 [Halanaerobiales bacterium]|nr:50S ribosomal protein L35 [Halanaerobiales bacterium]
MPKMKTHKGAKKRTSVSGKGKIKYKKSYKRHLLTSRSSKRIRNLRQAGYISKADEKNVKLLLPYSKF